MKKRPYILAMSYLCSLDLEWRLCSQSSHLVWSEYVSRGSQLQRMSNAMDTQKIRLFSRDWNQFLRKRSTVGIAYMVHVLFGQNWPFKQMSVYHDTLIIESTIKGQTRNDQAKLLTHSHLWRVQVMFLSCIYWGEGSWLAHFLMFLHGLNQRGFVDRVSR